MRIDHIVTTLGAGGAESLVVGLATVQAESGHDVRVWTLDRGQVESRDFQSGRVAELDAAGVYFDQIGTGPRMFPRAALTLRKRLSESSEVPNVLHCHSAATAASGALGASGVPIVMTLHATNFSFPRPLWRIISHKVEAVVAVSEESRRTFAGYFDKKIHVIENGIVLAQSPKSGNRSSGGIFKLLAVGNLRPEKNYARLITAFSQVLPQMTDAGLDIQLLIAGEGEDRLGLENQISTLALNDRVRLLGVRKDIPQLMSDADMFVMSSDHEGQPIALLESLSAGLPAVVTPFPSAFDVLAGGKVGAIADDFTPSALAATIVAMIFDQDGRALFAEAAVVRAQDFSIESCAGKYQDVYESAMGK